MDSLALFGLFFTIRIFINEKVDWQIITDIISVDRNKLRQLVMDRLSVVPVLRHSLAKCAISLDTPYD